MTGAVSAVRIHLELWFSREGDQGFSLFDGRFLDDLVDGAEGRIWDCVEGLFCLSLTWRVPFAGLALLEPLQRDPSVVDNSLLLCSQKLDLLRRVVAPPDGNLNPRTQLWSGDLHIHIIGGYYFFHSVCRARFKWTRDGQIHGDSIIGWNLFILDTGIDPIKVRNFITVVAFESTIKSLHGDMCTCCATGAERRDFDLLC